MILAASLVFVTSPAAAQFACTTTPTDITCTNAGTAAAPFTNTAAGANQNATTTNSGTASDITSLTGVGGNAVVTNSGTAGNLGSLTNAGGNATTTNSGSAAGMFAQTFGAGNATATNLGNNAGGIIAVTSGGGNATVNNAGIDHGITVQTGAAGGNATGINSGTNSVVFNVTTFGAGNATATNSGINTVGILVQTASGGDASLTNSGSNIGNLVAITSTGGNATVTNAGTNAGTVLVQAAGAGNALGINSGTISSGVFESIATGSGSATTINSGTVTGGLTLAQTSGIGNAVLTNSGTINGPATASALGGGAGTLTNSGTINGPATASALGGGAATLTNSGTINGQASVAAVGTGASTLNNAGTISNFGGVAVQMTGSHDTLNLLPGSRIIGGISLAGTNDTVNLSGGSHLLTFSGPGLAAATVNSAGPFVVVGNRIATIDATPFGFADRNLMDFSRGVSSILGSLGGAGAAANGPISSAFAPDDSFAARVDDAFAAFPALAYAGDAMVFKSPTRVAADGRAVWARGFGGERIQDADGPLLRATTLFMGGAVGFDVVARPDLRLGAFAGGGQSRLSLDLNQGRTDTDTVFGGVYGRWGFVSLGAPSFLDFALQGGSSRNATSRNNIDNNTLAGGLESATASYRSAYVSPELKYGINLSLSSEYTLTPSLQVRYVAGFFDGYTETGTTVPLTVASRTIQDLEERGELKLTRATPVGPDMLVTSLYVGALGIERLGDTTVNTVLLGANLPFVTPGKNNVAGVLGGGGMEWRTREGVAFFGAAEAIGMSDQGTVISARGGVRVAF